MKNIKIVDGDDYVYDIDEVKTITIKNNLGDSFVFEPESIKSIELIYITSTTTK